MTPRRLERSAPERSSRTAVAAAALLLAALLAPANAGPASAQEGPAATTTYRLQGASVEVHNVAGRVELVRGEGDAVRVRVTRRGRDSARLSVSSGAIDGRQTLRVRYPEGRVVYPGREDGGDVPDVLRWLGLDFDTEIEVREDGRLGDEGREIAVVSSGEGLRAWADLRVVVPVGRHVAVRSGVGRAVVRGVRGTTSVDVRSGPVEADSVRGALTLETGSGSVRAASVDGDLDVGTGSGGVVLEDVRGSRVRVGTGSGGVDGSGVRARTLSVETGSGGVELRSVAARDLSVETGSGSVTLGLVADLDSGRVATGSGSVEIRVPRGFGARLELDTGSGGIDVEVPAREVRADGGGWTGVVGDGRGTLRVDTGSGSIEISGG